MQICLVSLLLLLSAKSIGQNLVPNPSFEEYTSCPAFGGNGGMIMLCPPWVTIGSNDYFNECATFWPYGVPTNVFGGQFARTGAAYIGGHSYGFFREFAQVALTDTLEEGVCYKVGFYLNLGDSQCGIDHFGALLTSSAITMPLGMTPQVDLGGIIFTDTINWVYIFNTIVATGNETHITIGNFYTDAETTVESTCQVPTQNSYYFIEDVIVEEIIATDLAVEIDGPIEVCDSFLIVPIVDPDINDVLYIWSDGSRDSTLMVHTSGEYSVTVFSGCNNASAAVDVVILNETPVAFADDDVIMCSGNTYDITLDPGDGTYEWQDGSTDPNYTISETGLYHVTLDDGCHLSSDTINVTVVEPPEPLSLGSDTFLCPGDLIAFNLDPDQGEYVWQDGTQNPTYVIDEEGTYGFTVTNLCGTHSDQIEVIELIPPSFDIGPDTTRLCTGEILDITLNHTLGSYHWQDGNNSPFYIIDDAGVYSITVTNGCGIETDQMVVFMTAPPLISLGPDTSLCQGDTMLLDGGANTGTYQWQNGTTNTSLEVTTSGLYALSITNACGFDRDTVNITMIAAPPQPDLGPDINLCNGDIAVLSVNVPAASFVWNDLSTADTLLVDTAGTYYVQVANSCGTSSDTVIVAASDASPLLSLPGDFLLCQGDTAVIDVGISGVDYLWNDGSQSAQLMVSSPGTYALTVTNNCGTDSDTIVISDGGSLPSVSLGIDTSICSGTTLTITPVASNVNTWLWQDGSALPTYTTPSAGEVHVMVSNGCGVAYDTMQIALLPAIPILSIGPNASLCPGDTISFIIAIPDVAILWQDGTTGAAIEVTQAMTVHAMISNSCGTSADTLEVTMLPEIPSLDLGEDQAICPGETIVVNPGIAGVMYLWQDGSTGSSISATQEETITLAITNACGASTDTLEIYESTDGPMVDLGPDRVACAGDSVVLETNISGVNYVWHDGSSSASFTAFASGSYFVQVSNLCGSDSDTIHVEISGVAPTIELGADTILCEGSSLLLSYQPDAITSIEWQDGSDAHDIQVVSPGLYTLMASNRCGTDMDSIRIGFMEGPESFDLGMDTILCAGASIVLSAPATTNALVWQDGSTQSQLLVSAEDTYILVISNACGQQSDSITVGIDDQIPYLNLGPDTVLCAGDFISLDVTQAVPAHYLWNTGDETSMLSVLTPGMYSVTVFTECMMATDQIEIFEKTDCIPASTNTTFYIPNVFSPNDDQINDIFSVSFGSGITVLYINGSIFDRWGNMVYRSEDTSFSWDGKKNGTSMPPGVYVYALYVTYEVNGREVVEILSGDFTLVR